MANGGYRHSFGPQLSFRTNRWLGKLSPHPSCSSAHRRLTETQPALDWRKLEGTTSHLASTNTVACLRVSSEFHDVIVSGVYDDDVSA